MAEKFKVGDKIRRKRGHRFVHISNESEIIKIVSAERIGHELHVLYPPGTRDVWHGQYCELIEKKEEQEKLCRCDMNILMAVGCQCKGN